MIRLLSSLAAPRFCIESALLPLLLMLVIDVDVVVVVVVVVDGVVAAVAVVAVDAFTSLLPFCRKNLPC